MTKLILTGAAALFATAASAQIATPGSVPATGDEMPVAQEQLDGFAVPREVSPALMPYLICRQSEQGVALYDENGEMLNPDDPEESCDVTREKSKIHTIRLLGDLNLGRHRGERAEYAERWLTKIEELAEPAAG